MVAQVLLNRLTAAPEIYVSSKNCGFDKPEPQVCVGRLRPVAIFCWQDPEPNTLKEQTRPPKNI